MSETTVINPDGPAPMVVTVDDGSSTAPKAKKRPAVTPEELGSIEDRLEALEHPQSSPVVEEGEFAQAHVDAQPKTHAVLISADHTMQRSILFRNGSTFHDVPVGIETQVSELIYAAMTDSDVVFASRLI